MRRLIQIGRPEAQADCDMLSSTSHCPNHSDHQHRRFLKMMQGITSIINQHLLGIDGTK